MKQGNYETDILPWNNGSWPLNMEVMKQGNYET